MIKQLTCGKADVNRYIRCHGLYVAYNDLGVLLFICGLLPIRWVEFRNLRKYFIYSALFLAYVHRNAKYSYIFTIIFAFLCALPCYVWPREFIAMSYIFPIKFHCMECQKNQVNIDPGYGLGPFLLTWFNFNPSMDK